MIIQSLELNHLKPNQEIFSIVLFAVLALGVVSVMSIPSAQADNTIKQIVKISETYPSGVASADFPIDPPLTNLDKTFVFYTVSHTGEEDASDTFKSVEIVDFDTLRLKGEDTASGNLAVDFIAYVIEFDTDSEIDVQHLQESVAGTAGSQTFSMGSVNTTNSMIVFRGHHINASTTAVGNNDYDRIRIASSTTWELNVDTAPTTPEGVAVSVIDWNQTDISIQRGLFTMVNPSFTGEIIGGTDFTAIDPTRTMLLATYTTDGASSEDNDDSMVRISLTDGGDIRIFREDDDSELLVAWELIEFPSEFAKVTHFNSTIPNTALTVTVTVPEIRDYSKAIAISHSGTPFGYSGGSGDNGFSPAGAIDRSQVTLLIQNNTRVQLAKDDSAGDTEVGWQLIEFFEPDKPQNPQGTNSLRQVVKIEGQYTGSTVTQDFTISPALQSVNRTVLFLTTSNDNTPSADVAERMKRWGIIDTTTLRIHGSNDPLATNLPMNFSATLVEFDSTSAIFVQRDQIQYAHDLIADEKILHMSPVNSSGANIFYNGWTSTFADSTLGQEEFARLRIINGSTWGYSVELPSNDQESVAIANIVDWGSDKILVQRGQDTITGTQLIISPPTDIIRNQTILFSTFRTTSAEFEDQPDDAGLLGHLDNSSPPNIIFERVDGTDSGLMIDWEIISFPLRDVFVQHGIHNQTAGTSNSTSIITRPVANVTTAFAVGTVGTPMGYSNGKGSFTTNDSFGEISGKMTLDDTTTVRFERGLSVGSWDVGFQVIEFQDNFCEVCLETTATGFETTPPIEPDVTVYHQLLEWFEPENASLEGVIADLEVNGLKLFQILLKIHNGTYGVDGNLTSGSEFYHNQYLNETYTNVTDFNTNIEDQIRINFGAEPRP